MIEPVLNTFDPSPIPFQYEVIRGIRKNFDYSLGVHEILLSGALGSSKTTLMAHLAITHCCMFPRACFLIGRQAMPDLKRTLYKKILAHIHPLERNKDWFENKSSSLITFANGSQIVSTSWADGHVEKVRSMDISAAAIEELTENEPEDINTSFYTEIKMRIGRCPGVFEKFLISATNPGSESSVWYDYFELPKPTSNTKHVYYSITDDNPFLPVEYKKQLKKDLDPKLARRMLYGEWIDLITEVIYHAYDPDRNFIKGEYKFDQQYPLHIAWDFNIAIGKPLSCTAFQYIEDNFHFFDEVVIDGIRTQDSCEELAGKGILDLPCPKVVIHGDATGRSRDTRNKRSDYDIIKKYLENYTTKDGRKLNVEMEVPLSNPAIRDRHNKMNAYFVNELEENRMFVYSKAKTLDKGFRISKLKKGSAYIEDDSKSYQHVTTAAGYGVVATLNKEQQVEQRTLHL